MQTWLVGANCVHEWTFCEHLLNRSPSWQNIVTHLNFDLLVVQQRNKEWYNSGLNNHLDLVIASVREIRQCPNRIYQDLKRTSNSLLKKAQLTTNHHLLYFLFTFTLPKKSHSFHLSDRYNKDAWLWQKECRNVCDKYYIMQHITGFTF